MESIGTPLPIRRYTLSVPFDLPPGTVDLFVGEQFMGSMRAYYTHAPTYFTRTAVSFADQIQLVGFAPDMSGAGETLAVHLAFKANPKAWADYTVFVHFITPAGERLTGHDAQPRPPTSQWDKTEVVLDTHIVPLPSDLSTTQTYQIRVGLYQSESGEVLGEPYVLPVEVRLP